MSTANHEARGAVVNALVRLDKMRAGLEAELQAATPLAEPDTATQPTPPAFPPDTTILAACRHGARPVAAETYGQWGVHREIGRRGVPQSTWAVTHIPTGFWFSDGLSLQYARELAVELDDVVPLFRKRDEIPTEAREIWRREMGTRREGGLM